VLEILAAQEDADVAPGMIVLRAIVIAAKELMEIDVEPPIARDKPPAPEIWLVAPPRSQNRADA
jgi:hypothetical protein